MVHQPLSEVPPSVPAAGSYHQAPATVGSAWAALPTNWWQTFQDPDLDALMEEALAANLELRQLAARMEQAHALLRQARGRLYPSLEGSAGYDSSWINQKETSGTRHEESASAGGLLSWELDVWGRLRSLRGARKHEAQAAVLDWEAGRLLLTASVAETYFEVLEHRQQLELIQEQLEINQTLLALTKLRFGQGQSSIVDVLQQKEQLASTRARVPDLEARLEQLEYGLDVLAGRSPGDREWIAARALQPPPALPGTGVPSDLLERRPDLAAVRQRVTAFDYRVGEAIAERLPRFVIGGSLFESGDPGLGTLVSRAFASAVGPIFDAGIRKAEVDRRRAELEEIVAEYSQTYLTAVQEVETALVRERKQADRVRLLADQLETAQRLLVETRNRYSQGLTDYLPVLAAVVTEQNLQRDYLTSQREWLSYRVALHRALGGPLEGPPEAQTLSGKAGTRWDGGNLSLPPGAGASSPRSPGAV